MMRRAALLFIWIFFPCGGLLHRFDLLAPLRRVTNLPALLGATALVCLLALSTSPRPIRAGGWLGLLTIFGFCIEVAGVHTGQIFGSYHYGEALGPKLYEVPWVMGPAWTMTTTLGAALTFGRLPALPGRHAAEVVIGSLLVVLFDVMMEPAAPRLDYWYFVDGLPPFQNFAAWFTVALLFLTVAKRLRLFPRPMPPLLCHLYLAQITYFAIIIS